VLGESLLLGHQSQHGYDRRRRVLEQARIRSQREFRYRGSGLDALTVRWNSLLDRGIEETLLGAATPTLVNQGGADIIAYGRKYLNPETRIAGSVEYLSSYIYRLAFDETLAQATSSEVQSDAALTHNHNGFLPSVTLGRFESFAGTPLRVMPRL
jgi:LPS-assembly protein